MNKLIIILLLLLIVVIIVLFILNYIKEKPKVQDLEKFYQDKLILYYSEFCGHCKNFKPIWEQFCKENKSTIETLAINCEKETDKCPDYIQGYPTVMLYKQNGEKIMFNGQRTIQGLIDFIGQH